MAYSEKRAKLAVIKDYLTICINDENAKHEAELKKLDGMKDSYKQDYINNLFDQETQRHETAVQGCYNGAANTLDELYNIIINEKPDIFCNNFTYAKEMAQLLGNKMTNEQASAILEPLRGQVTSLDILRTVYERNGAPVEVFNSLTFYEPATDIEPEKYVKDIFNDIKESLYKNDSITTTYKLRQVADKLLGTGDMDFTSDNKTTTEIPAIL